MLYATLELSLMASPVAAVSGTTSAPDQPIPAVFEMPRLRIPLYAAFFIANAWTPGGWIPSATVVLAAPTGLLDYAEDFATLRLTRGKEARPSRFGYWKWLFFFTTTGLQALPAIRAFEQSPWEWWA
jgi:hypothetical protein